MIRNKGARFYVFVGCIRAFLAIYPACRLPPVNVLYPAERASGPVERMHEAGPKARPGAHDDSHIANAPGFSEGRVRRGMLVHSQAAEFAFTMGLHWCVWMGLSSRF